MKREIKFRCWNKKIKDWITDFGIADNGDIVGLGYIAMSRSPQEEDEIIMQYTGLKDAEDREIYEGDILEYNDEERSITDDFVEPVKWNEDLGHFCTDSSDHVWAEVARMSHVIGNIYENPELLS